MLNLLAQSQNLEQIKPLVGGYNKVANSPSDISTPASGFELLITNSLTVLTIVGGIMFIIYFLLGGLQWVSGGGDKGKIDKAKNMMTNAAIGLIIITLSYSIAWIVGKALGIDILQPAQILKNTIKF